MESRNLRTTKTWLSISLAVEDEGEKKAEDDSQGFLLNVMNREKKYRRSQTFVEKNELGFRHVDSELPWGQVKRSRSWIN